MHSSSTGKAGPANQDIVLADSRSVEAGRMPHRHLATKTKATLRQHHKIYKTHRSYVRRRDETKVYWARRNSRLEDS
jgi:hypothetical protein